MRTLVVTVGCVALMACGGTAAPNDDAGTKDGTAGDVSISDATKDGPNLDGPYACGTKTCTTGEYCIHPCCGGLPPPCVPRVDGGACGPGSHADPNCTEGCRSDPCTPPPVYCAKNDACINGLTSGRDATCLCQ